MSVNAKRTSEISSSEIKDSESLSKDKVNAIIFHQENRNQNRLILKVHQREFAKYIDQ